MTANKGLFWIVYEQALVNDENKYFLMEQMLGGNDQVL